MSFRQVEILYLNLKTHASQEKKSFIFYLRLQKLSCVLNFSRRIMKFCVYHTSLSIMPVNCRRVGRFRGLGETLV